MAELKIIINEDKSLELGELKNNTVNFWIESFWSDNGSVQFEINKDQAEKIIYHLREQFKL